MTVTRLQDYVTRQSDRRPDATALVDGDQAVTYQTLERRSNQMARLLLEGGCEPGDRVGLLLPKSSDAIITMLGVLKAGGLYVPVDPESPTARIEKILTAAECRYVFAGKSATSLLNNMMRTMAAEARPGLVWMDETPTDGGITPRFTKADVAALNDEPLPGSASAQGRPGSSSLYLGLDRRTQGRDRHPRQCRRLRRLGDLEMNNFPTIDNMAGFLAERQPSSCNPGFEGRPALAVGQDAPAVGKGGA